MTKEECIALLNRYAEYNGIGIPNLAGCREAMRTAAELLQRPSLPYNLDEAAEESAERWRKNPDGSESRELFFQPYIRGFKAGAECMAGQGETIEGEVCGRVRDHINVKFSDGVGELLTPSGISHIPADVSKYNIGDKVVVQIRKK